MDAFPIHGGCGAWGTLAVGLLDRDKGLFYGKGFHMLGIQTMGVVSIAAWTMAWSFLFFFILKKLGLLRIEHRYELAGGDILSHGGNLLKTLTSKNSLDSFIEGRAVE